MNTQVLYGCEFAMAMALMANGCLTVSLSDNLHNTCLRNLNVLYTKVGLAAYPTLFLMRGLAYLDVVKWLKLMIEIDLLTLYENLFAVYAHKQINKFIMTSIVLALYVLSYIFAIMIIKTC